MCKSDLHPLLQALPKCEHHLHLEGGTYADGCDPRKLFKTVANSVIIALTPEVLFRLAAKNNIQLPKDDAAFESAASLQNRYGDFSSLDDFLHYYYIGMSVLLDESDFEALAWDCTYNTVYSFVNGQDAY